MIFNKDIKKYGGEGLLIAIALFLLSVGCAASKSQLLQQSLPGDILVIHQSTVQAFIFVFQGYKNRDTLLTSTPTGYQIDSKPLYGYKMAPVYSSKIFFATRVSPLQPDEEYTLWVIFKNAITGQYLDMDLITVRTSSNPFNEYYDPGGRKTYASRIVYLRKVDPNTIQRLDLKITIPLTQIIRDLLGLP